MIKSPGAMTHSVSNTEVTTEPVQKRWPLPIAYFAKEVESLFKSDKTLRQTPLRSIAYDEAENTVLIDVVEGWRASVADDIADKINAYVENHPMADGVAFAIIDSGMEERPMLG